MSAAKRSATPERDESGRTAQERIDEYVRTYDVRTLAGMLVETEDAYAPYAAGALRRASKQIMKKGGAK